MTLESLEWNRNGVDRVVVYVVINTEHSGWAGRTRITIFQVLPSDPFAGFKWPFQGVKWPVFGWSKGRTKITILVDMSNFFTDEWPPLVKKNGMSAQAYYLRSYGMEKTWMSSFYQTTSWFHLYQPMVNCWFGLVVWIPGIPENARNCYFGVPRFESQTTN